jgi:hypothetical protein
MLSTVDGTKFKVSKLRSRAAHQENITLRIEQPDLYSSVEPRGKVIIRPIPPGWDKTHYWAYEMRVEPSTGRKIDSYEYVWDGYRPGDEGLFHVLLQLGNGNALNGYGIMQQEKRRFEEHRAIIAAHMGQERSQEPSPILYYRSSMSSSLMSDTPSTSSTSSRESSPRP